MPPTPYQTALDRIRQAADSGAESLDLSNLGLTSLPPEIKHLTKLRQLDLSSNPLNILPPEIGQLINLTKIDIWGCLFTILPPEIGCLVNLKYINMAHNRIISLPPEIAQLTNLRELHFVNNKLSNLPLEIGQIANLIELNLSSNELTNLPFEITNLINLRSLAIGGNQLTNLPPEILRFQNLTKLYLSENQLVNLPSEIVKLTNLKELYLESNLLTTLPPEIGQLTKLTKLNLSDNQLTGLPPEIGQLTRLIELKLYGNQLKSLLPEIGQLINLTELDLQNTRLTSLSPEIGRLTSLTQLDIHNNQLTNLPPEIGQLTNLTKLDLRNTQLTSLPPEIRQLTNLTELYLDHNQITSLPKEMVKLRNLKRITLRSNPLEIAIPAKWLEDENKPWEGSKYPQEFLSYYKRMYEQGGRELGEARVLVVGEGEVGKSTLVKRLIDDVFDPNIDTTRDIEKHTLPLGDICAQVWDFGGQEHMHATHQFFFSGRSLYLLVFDTRSGYEAGKVEDWLDIINMHSKNAPVILVGNKCDQHEMDIEKGRLHRKYPNLKHIISTSTKTGEHIAELRQKIQEEVRAMPQVRVLFSADYLAVKDEMENLDKPHISHEQFIEICERHGVSDPKDQDTLLDLLHDLGTVLYFRDADGNPLLPALGVLNPNWVTGGVYLIVTNPALKDKFKGRLTMSLLREILSAREYSLHIEDIMKLLERFELCYPAGESTYWLPSLMEKDEPAALGDFASAMKFEYKYDALPKSVIVRFIVKAHKTILDNQVWRYGVVLKLDGNTALIRADERDKRVSIFIAGEESTRRDALAILRAHFDDIHAMFATPPEAFIYPPQYPDLRLPFEQMKTLAKTERERTEVHQGKPVTINLRELLDGFVTPQERRKDEEQEEKGVGRRGDIYVHVGDMHGSTLTIGDDNTSSVNVSNSFNSFPVELQTALTELITAAQTLLQKAEESEHKEEVKEELESLQSEAKKSKPKAERIKVTVEGLKKAAENIRDIGVPVVELAMKILPLLSAG